MTDDAQSGYIQHLWQSSVLWVSVAIGGFSMTAYVYGMYGFIPSFVPFLIAIFAMRRVLHLKLRAEADEDETESIFDIDPEHEYSETEQIDVLEDIRTHYSKKRTTWVVLTVVSIAITIFAVQVSVVIAVLLAAVTTYEMWRTIKTHRAIQLASDRIAQLETVD